MPRLHRYSYSPARADDEADLFAEATRQGVKVFFNGQARREGRPHVEIKARRNELLKAFTTPAAALEWLETRLAP